ncbi:hypothetical protein ACFXI6_52190 [Streptomyces mirabilis]|uniref:hypothetical protein n=1 Tax=Streptomyces mirabilis TaxID=68239 RepID=UPI0036B2B8BE
MTDEQIRFDRTLAAWDRIETWLLRYAPQSHAALPGPAEPSVVESAGAAMGPLPPELRALWGLHNGTDRDGPGRLRILKDYDVFPVADAIWCYENVLTVLLDANDMGTRPWIPACASETDEPHLWNFIDTTTGRLGSNVHAGAFTEPDESGDTFVGWMEGIAAELEGGGGAAGSKQRPSVIDGWLTWNEGRHHFPG